MADRNDIDLRADLWLHTREKLEAGEGVNLYRVSDLIDHFTMEWNHNRIKQHFQPQIAFKFVQTPIRRMAGQDEICCPYTSNGEYSVRSGYQQVWKSHDSPRRS